MTYPYACSVVLDLPVKKERWPGNTSSRVVSLVYPGQEVVPDQLVLRLEPLASTSASTDTSSGGENIPAGLHGRVVGLTARGGVLIEGRAALVQGLLGVGHQVAGVLTFWQPSSSSPSVIPPGAILVVPGPLSLSLLHQALNSGVIGVVASSMALRDLEGFLRTDYIQLLYADLLEDAYGYLPPLTLLLTEGPGSLPMPVKTRNLLRRYDGSIALLSGATSVRHGLYPDLLISLPPSEEQNDVPFRLHPALTLGSQVRICGGRRNGLIGILDHFLLYEYVFPSGILARAARVRLTDGSFAIEPLALLAKIG